MTAGGILVRPHGLFRASYVEALREGFVWAARAPLEADVIAFVDSHFSDYLRRLDEDGQVPMPGAPALSGVPSNTFWLVEDRDFIGAVNIRCRIDTPALAHFGGHVGYAVRPGRRRQGHGTRLLALALDICRGMGLGIVRLSCVEDNIGSRRVIEANGGLLLRRCPPAWYAPDPYLLYEIPLI
ncbi:GNAT family N-acetyltransferase [Xanthobacter sp. V4C-4]|uniref:GNAT family N-acetyltransferase n=1 Tax=Xanthobacter cornucopiae TaxID=3119924 RepID=UPI003728B57F